MPACRWRTAGPPGRREPGQGSNREPWRIRPDPAEKPGVEPEIPANPARPGRKAGG